MHKRLGAHHGIHDDFVEAKALRVASYCLDFGSIVWIPVREQELVKAIPEQGNATLRAVKHVVLDHLVVAGADVCSFAERGLV